MKHLILVLVLGLTTPLLAKSPNAEDYFKQGETALKEGKIALAESSYRSALKLDPKHGNAKYRLLSMKDLTASARIKARQDKLNSIILPKVAFEDLTLEESLEGLAVMVEKASDKTFVPNFVIEDTSGTIKKNKVNISLRNIPASVALKYVLSQSKSKVSWDAHVITVRPLAGGSTTKAVTTEAKKK
ncbi:MAG: hypothetical protein ACSHYB_12130 [Roseibacillus sp.]